MVPKVKKSCWFTFGIMPNFLWEKHFVACWSSLMLIWGKLHLRPSEKLRKRFLKKVVSFTFGQKPSLQRWKSLEFCNYMNWKFWDAKNLQKFKIGSPRVAIKIAYLDKVWIINRLFMVELNILLRHNLRRKFSTYFRSSSTSPIWSLE